MILLGMTMLLPAFCQNSTQGTEFWLSFMTNGYQFHPEGGWVKNQVMVSAQRNCSGVLKNPHTGWSANFDVQANNITMIDVPLEQAYHQEADNERVIDRGLQIVTTDTVSVYCTNLAHVSFDASFVLPYPALGCEYLIQCDNQSHSSGNTCWRFYTSCVLIVATEDNTVVEITPSVRTLGNKPANQLYIVSLNRGQTYQIRSDNDYNMENRDLSGTRIATRGGKRIAVFNGNNLTTVPVETGNGFDHVFEQALPVDSWGQSFVVTASSARTRDYVKVVSSADNNKILVNGELKSTLQTGETYGFWIWNDQGGADYVETSEPSAVYLYNTSMYADYDEFGDPSMVWITPVEQRISEITFSTFDDPLIEIQRHYVNVVVNTDDIGEVMLDGSPIAAASFSRVSGNPDYSFARLFLTHGVHHLSCENGVVAHVYGFGNAKGYAYCVGSNVIDLRGNLRVNGISGERLQRGVYVCQNDHVDYLVKTNYQIDSVNWTFGDGLSGQGAAISHSFAASGDYTTTAFVFGYNAFDGVSVHDTMSALIRVGAPELYSDAVETCDEDIFDYYGVVYDTSGVYDRIGTNIYGCDSLYHLELDMDFTPYFAIEGEQWPIGGSETHFSVYDYSIHLEDERSSVDTVIWSVDCPNWYIVPHGKGETCTLYIYSYLLEPVGLHATVVNRCNSVTNSFSIKTSYYGVEENLGLLSVTPNPTSGDVMIDFGNLSGETSVKIYDVHGSLVDEFSLNLDGTAKTFPYSIRGIDSGLCYLVISNNGILEIFKILINK